MARTITDETRRRMSDSAKARCTKKWRAAMSKRHSTPLSVAKITALYAAGHTQAEIAEKLGTIQGVVCKFMKRNKIAARVAAKRDQCGAKNHQWKGNGAAYSAMHKRISRLFGQPKECKKCGSKSKRRSYDWASLTGDYGNAQDYMRMCRSCHRQYDYEMAVKRSEENVPF